jgi:2-polyprenyl-3-methyl-5-hydroxy-6-metoxy-1,4-benzoquinol methylase
MLVGMDTIDTSRLDTLVDRVFSDFSAAMTLPLIRLGDRLGLYQALRDHGPIQPAQLAEHCQIPEPVAHEWLANQAAAGYVDVDAAGERFTLTPEQAAVFVDESSGSCLQAAFQLAAAYTRSEPSVTESLRTGHHVTWGDHDPDLFAAVERFYRPAYSTALVPEWIPALDGVEAGLREGAEVADVGCGHGLSTVLMAQAFPASRFVGIDDHPSSIERACKLAGEEGVAHRTRFEVRPARELDGSFDLITVLDAFHDMGAPEEVASRLRSCLKPNGVVLVVEPLAGDRLTDNLTPLGRVYYAASTLACTPSALSQSDARPLGAQAGPARLMAALGAGGFGTIRVAATTPFNLVLEARP